MDDLMTDAELVAAAIAATGLSRRAFARKLFRNPSTIWSWLRSDHPVPDIVKQECRRILADAAKASP